MARPPEAIEALACALMSVYRDLGLRPLINAWGTVTAVGGSLLAPEVLDAMREAAGAYVDLHALQARAGERIAAALDVEAACVTAGAAAGLTVATAAAMTRDHPEQRARLPRASGLPDECLMLRGHRNRYDTAVAVAGARVVEVEDATGASVEELRRALSDRTALLLWMAEARSLPGSPPLAEVAAVLHEHGIPLVVDAAAEVPPRALVRQMLDEGADLVVLSGGKEVRGPQSSGMILGRRELVAACAAVAYPHHGVARGMKTDKETIVGLVAAVELFARRDEAAEQAARERMVSELVAGLAGCVDLRVRRHVLERPGIQPASIPRAYVRPLHATAAAVAERLRSGDPAVVVGVDGDEIALNPQCLTPEQVPVVVQAVIRACVLVS